MSFDIDRWSRQTLANNTGAVTLEDSSVVNGPALFTYESADDTIATIAGADYFADAAFDLAVGDIIIANGSDASNMLVVATVDRSTPSVTVTSFTTSGVVGTANIQDGAVTEAKLNASVAGDGLSGGGGTALSVNVDDSTIEIDTDTLRVKDDGITNAKLAEDTIKTTTVTVSTAELLALATTPKELVAAPGADKFIQFLGAQLVLDYNSVQYTESGDNLGIKYTDASGVQVSADIEMTGFIDQAADTITNAIPAADAIVAASGAVNQALVLDNLGSNFAAGNSPVDVIVSYKVLTAGLA